MRRAFRHLTVRLALGCAAAFVACLFFSNSASAAENPPPSTPHQGEAHPVAPTPRRTAPPASHRAVVDHRPAARGLVPGLLHRVATTTSHTLPALSSTLDRTLRSTPLLTSVTTTATDRLLAPTLESVGRLTTSVSAVTAQVTGAAGSALRPLGLSQVPATTQTAVGAVLGPGTPVAAAPATTPAPARPTTPAQPTPPLRAVVRAAQPAPALPHIEPTTTASAPRALSAPTAVFHVESPGLGFSVAAPPVAQPALSPGSGTPQAPAPPASPAQDLMSAGFGSQSSRQDSGGPTGFFSLTFIPLPAASPHESLGYSWLPPASRTADPDYSPD
ncbi:MULTISPECIES: hypothetical protein [Arthrobacter]|uniref:Uncharacterized protein n=2 Tax=Arthrobacter TaxID=1663 RepID=A0ABU9KRE0_9MICC|nr:hypothetical protein [Arthrobacter sp. YJM1]MDP5228731.1 hypothetical protein [Arthrobacter sp. YJM1]